MNELRVILISISILITSIPLLLVFKARATAYVKELEYKSPTIFRTLKTISQNSAYENDIGFDILNSMFYIMIGLVMGFLWPIALIIIIVYAVLFVARYRYRIKN